MKAKFKQIVLLCATLSSLSCASPEIADRLYFGGSILTMEDQRPEVEALATKGGKIIFAGNLRDAQEFVGEATQEIDLNGKTLLPGFIDVHGHITSRAGMEQAVDLSPTPYGSVNSIPDLQRVIKAYIDKNALTAGIPVLGNGYDDAIMVEHTHPTRTELDAISATIPIIVIHTSGHASVANSAMLRLLGIPEDVKDPVGGHYGRDMVTKKLNGKLEENASFDALVKLTNALPKPPESADGLSSDLRDFVKAQDGWIRYGQTTICDGRSMGVGLTLLRKAAEKKLLKVDLVYFPDFEANKKEWETFLPHYMKYENRLKFGGFKFSDDGSPQGKTAWLTEPYFVPPEGQTKDYKGFPIFSDSLLYEDLKIVFSKGITAQLHVNGDAAIDQALRVIGRLKAEGVYKPALRATLIHVQNSRPDHIAKIKEIGVIPSYFSGHVYLWGDWHYQSVFGPKRAAFISPAHAAKTAGIPFTIHHDAPVTPPDLLMGVYSAVNRVTRSGMVLGPDQRISPWEALQAITIHAARQYQEEDKKGSLAVGKLADLVVLNENPLKIDPLKIKDIKVEQTIKEGAIVYQRKD